jgi:ankyrin repeat protein
VTRILALILILSAVPASAGDSPLADASEKKDWPTVRFLLVSRSDPNAPQPDGTTALHWACEHDQPSFVESLIRAGANSKAANRYGVTPLTLACVNGSDECVKHLLAAGADANATLTGGETVLMTAARTGKVGPIDRLLSAGAKVDAADKKGQTALMWAAADGHADAVTRLLKAGADAKKRLPSGFTPMLFAVRNGKAKVVDVFLKAGVSADESFVVQKKGGGLAAPNGLTALHLAIENGHFELAATLLKAGANANDQKAGLTPLHRLAHVRKPNRGDDPDGQPPPTGSGPMTSLDLVDVLVKHGADVNARVNKGSRSRLATTGATPFLFAAKTADLPYLKKLVSLGADPTLTNANGSTPLMAAAGLGSDARQDEAGTEPEALVAVQYLLSLNADVNAKDQNGETAMHGAAYKCFPLVVRLLAERGAKVEVWNAKNQSGWTPLMIAEGFRPGNFTPSFETLAALHEVLTKAGVPIPPPTPRPAGGPLGYDKKP